MRYRRPLLESGVEIFEYKPFSDAKADEARDSHIGSSSASLHAKFLAFDRRYMFVGSFNLDGRSVALNTEIGVYFESPGYAMKLHENFATAATVEAYQVVVSEDGDLEWRTVERGVEQRFEHEPETSFWTRVTVRLLSIIVPERLL
jgi:putative cardiolipin synthase